MAALFDAETRGHFAWVLLGLTEVDFLNAKTVAFGIGGHFSLAMKRNIFILDLLFFC